MGSQPFRIRRGRIEETIIGKFVLSHVPATRKPINGLPDFARERDYTLDFKVLNGSIEAKWFEYTVIKCDNSDGLTAYAIPLNAEGKPKRILNIKNKNGKDQIITGEKKGTRYTLIKIQDSKVFNTLKEIVGTEGVL